MRFTTLVRLAYPGSLTDRVRIAITIVGALLAGLSVLAIGTVLNMAPTERRITLPDGGWSLDPYSWRYTSTLLNESGLRPGLIAMVAATIIPALVLLAQAARLGGPARDHRLATLRLAGATPRQARTIAAASQAFTVAIGGVLAAATYPLVKWLLHHPTMDGVRITAAQADGGPETHPYTGLLLPLPTDTWPAWWSWVVVIVVLPLVAGLISMAGLRRLIKSPVEASRRARRERPRIWPVWLVAAGLADMSACRAWIDALDRAGQSGDRLIAPYVLLVVGIAVICVGVPLSAATVAYLGAKITLRYAHRPAPLIAARRVLADPYAGSRAVSALLVCAVVFGALIGIRTQMDFDLEVQALYGQTIGDRELYELVMNMLSALSVIFIGFAAVGLLIALVDAAMTRRRTEAALLAAGTSTRVLVNARMIGVFLVAVPGVLLGLATGFASPSLASGPQHAPAAVETVCHDLGNSELIVPCTEAGVAQQKKADRDGGNNPAYSWVEYHSKGPWHAVHAPIPWARLGLAGGVDLLAIALVTILSLLVGRRSPAETALRTT
ncbi:MAG: hypothetical protein HOV77_21845 [Hamadaea sp.]|uniref:FtsX-like permease family protein n=1 Tax=Hamadaea sp. TaxID=2024425 RepID=UPI0017F170EA|nr:FtsX-like permease family protein [Hamadaea sp.]NUT21826.1 hypothetical protein [Hamadaea sp.]